MCGFRIIKKNKEIPFQVSVVLCVFERSDVNNVFSQIELVDGLGILKAKRSLNCEKRKTYKFEISAVLCDGTHSKR